MRETDRRLCRRGGLCFRDGEKDRLLLVVVVCRLCSQGRFGVRESSG